MEYDLRVIRWNEPFPKRGLFAWDPYGLLSSCRKNIVLWVSIWQLDRSGSLVSSNWPEESQLCPSPVFCFRGANYSKSHLIDTPLSVQWDLVRVQMRFLSSKYIPSPSSDLWVADTQQLLATSLFAHITWRGWRERTQWSSLQRRLGRVGGTWWWPGCRILMSISCPCAHLVSPVLTSINTD